MLVHRERLEQPAPLRHVADALGGDHVGQAPAQFLAEHPDRAPRLAAEAHDGVAERRLAHAVAADQGDRLGAHRERDALEDVRRAVERMHVLELQERRVTHA